MWQNYRLPVDALLAALLGKRFVIRPCRVNGRHESESQLNNRAGF